MFIVHARRRQALSSYFSMQSIRALEPRITDLVQQMNRRLHEASSAGNAINTNHLFSAFAMDVIAEYSLSKAGTTGSLSRPDLGQWWYDLTRQQVPMNAFFRHFPLVIRTMMMLSDWLAMDANPGIENFIWWRNKLMSQVKTVLERDDGVSNEKERTLTHELANSDLPPAEKPPSRLVAEANLLLGAGAETTASTIARTCYHTLANPAVLKQLQKELVVALPVTDAIPSLPELSQLPYLNTVIEECLSISLPILARSPRLFQNHTLQYKEWAMPPGLGLIVFEVHFFPISSSIVPVLVQQTDRLAYVSYSVFFALTTPNIFPEPESFKTSRWLASEGSARS
ncbi:uncharacterized protein A1O9_12575 [Exophiala aquamarina CBS 119918]|uniref:Cytochrome P450 oxidoreductase n=1 Tax=Exophiala aquamarina CBS 119918 TaxID=1182545 RepID=A0A072NUY8_9EURO|nr:uncharacterized protein A1O9_12575 [Exophiala aquamarina CBS 119918]KEF51426.1 hypothetical protein A1O9_12575 [Exophiala aquamarina CBS 119918]